MFSKLPTRALRSQCQHTCRTFTTVPSILQQSKKRTTKPKPAPQPAPPSPSFQARRSMSTALPILSKKRTTKPKPAPNPTPTTASYLGQRKMYGTATTADSLMEAITDQYGTAYDEFDIACEETEKKTVYAEDDRAAAVEEFDKLKNMYDEALKGEFAEEVKRRVGSRVRELERGVEELQKRAMED